MKYDVIIKNSCKKDIKKAKEQGKNLTLLFEIVDQLSEGKTLDPKYKDHKLSGDHEGKRECHIEPDFFIGLSNSEKCCYSLLNKSWKSL